MFKPECLPDGSYKPMQCYEHRNFGKWCWCVDGKGQEVIGSKVDNTRNNGNLTDEKCKTLGTQNATEEYWTAFYRHTTTTPTPAVIVTTTPIPIVLAGVETTKGNVL